jgi:hypothetical protein
MSAIGGTAVADDLLLLGIDEGQCSTLGTLK